MKKTLFILLLSALSSLSLFAQQNYAQELVDELSADKCFEAYYLKKQYNDSLPQDESLDFLYKYKMAQFFNKPDSAAIYLEQLIAEHESIFGVFVGGEYGTLISLYASQQQYEKAIETCDSAVAYFNRNPYGLEEELTAGEIIEIRKMKADLKEESQLQPRRRIERDEENTPVPITVDNWVHFDAEFNGITINTMFDTGVTFPIFMQKEIADSIGVRIIYADQDSVKQLNGLPVNSTVGVIDSIKFGSVRLYNMPVMVFNQSNLSTVSIPDSIYQDPDLKAKIDSIDHIMKVVIGLPAMNMIGRFEFDWEKGILTMPENIADTQGKGFNIYQFKNVLYAHMGINDLLFTGQLDTGAADTFISIDTAFYNKFPHVIQIDTTASISKGKNIFMLGHLQTGIDYKAAKDARVEFDNKILPLDLEDVLIYPVNRSIVNIRDGAMGFNFFRRLGKKTILDLDNMRLEGE